MAILDLNGKKVSNFISFRTEIFRLERLPDTFLNKQRKLLDLNCQFLSYNADNIGHELNAFIRRLSHKNR